jgi:GNAT superfamily N-acetyltransferase
VVGWPHSGMSAVYAASMRPNDGSPARVRPATSADAAELARLRWEHCLELWDRPGGDAPDRAAFDDEFLRFLRGIDGDDRWRGWVAESPEGGGLVGTLSLHVVPMLPTPWASGRAWGYVTSIQVDRAWRGRGLGRALMEAAEAWARDRGLEQLLLWAAGESPAFYEAVGFRRPPIVMERPLP